MVSDPENSEGIEEMIEKLFTKTENGYVPRDLGRQEYRKCGNKSPVLTLQIEEVLFNIRAPDRSLDEYARAHGYIYFQAYRSIRERGWILIPCLFGEYLYEIHPPNKEFNRKDAVAKEFLKIVPPLSHLDPAVFSLTDNRPVVFAISDADSFVLVRGEALDSAKSLVAKYAPPPRK